MRLLDSLLSLEFKKTLVMTNHIMSSQANKKDEFFESIKLYNSMGKTQSSDV